MESVEQLVMNEGPEIVRIMRTAKPGMLAAELRYFFKQVFGRYPDGMELDCLYTAGRTQDATAPVARNKKED